MSTLSPIGARNLPASPYAAGNTPTDTKAHHANSARQSGAVADYPISLSNDGVDLQKRIDAVGNRTVDYAQNLLGSFAQQLFGDAGKGATVSFDSASLDVSSSYAEGIQHTEGAGGVTDAAALQLNDSSHFLGKGTITTSDGRKFDFEVEIQYNYQLQASASQSQNSATPANPATPAVPASSGAPATAASPATPAVPAGAGDTEGADSGTSTSASNNSLPTVVFPNIDFQGTLADLFKLIGHDLHGTLSTPSGDKSQGNSIDRTTLRSLSLRLRSLIDHKSTDTYSGSKAKSVANAYGATQNAVNAAKPAANDAVADSSATAATTAAAPAAAASVDKPADSTADGDGAGV